MLTLPILMLYNTKFKGIRSHFHFLKKVLFSDWSSQTEYENLCMEIAYEKENYCFIFNVWKEEKTNKTFFLIKFLVLRI